MAFRKKILWVSYPVFIFILLELAFRWYDSRFWGNKGLVDHGTFYVHKPCVDFMGEDENGNRISVLINEDGLRARPGGQTEGDKIIVLGDSFVELDNTPYESSLCGLLENRLSGSGYSVLNAGINGYSNYHAYYLLDHISGRYWPSVVVLMVYLDNDLRDNLQKPVAYRSKAIEYFHKALRLFNCQTKGYYDFEINTFRNKPGPWVRKALNNTEQALSLLSGYCKKDKARLIVIGIPSKAQVYRDFRLVSHFDALHGSIRKAFDVIRDPGGYSFDNPSSAYESICRKQGIEYHSLLPLFRENRAQDIYGAIDYHWNVYGQELAAAYISSLIENK